MPGESAKIFYFHVPFAWCGLLAYIISGILSVIYLVRLKDKTGISEQRAFNSCVIGLAYTILATVTGSVWSKLAWGSFWNWDPRQTSIAGLLLIYIAYFSLRSGLRDSPARGRICSAYLILAAAAAPFFVFIVPRAFPSLHPDPIINPGMSINMDLKMTAALAISLISFTWLYAYLLDLLNKKSPGKTGIPDDVNES